MKSNILKSIAIELGSNKFEHLNYDKHYERHFNEIRMKKMNILEIGVQKGLSLLIWKKYFENSDIYGIEINPEKINSNVKDNFEIFIGDQSDTRFLKKVCKRTTEYFDVIIDDGSHLVYDQVISFKYLFNKIKPGGTYVIEDLHTSYSKYFVKTKSHEWKKNIKLKKMGIIRFINYLSDNINYYEAVKNNSIKPSIRRMKLCLSFYSNQIQSIDIAPGLAFISKREDINDK